MHLLWGSFLIRQVSKTRKPPRITYWTSSDCWRVSRHLKSLKTSKFEHKSTCFEWVSLLGKSPENLKSPRTPYRTYSDCTEVSTHYQPLKTSKLWLNCGWEAWLHKQPNLWLGCDLALFPLHCLPPSGSFLATTIWKPSKTPLDAFWDVGNLPDPVSATQSYVFSVFDRFFDILMMIGDDTVVLLLK